jgi:hypothetical protein
MVDRTGEPVNAPALLALAFVFLPANETEANLG